MYGKASLLTFHYFLRSISATLDPLAFLSYDDHLIP